MTLTEDRRSGTGEGLGWPWVIGAGIALGALGVLADEAGYWFWTEHRSTSVAVGYMILTIIGNAPGFWALSAIMVAGGQPSVRSAVFRAFAFLAIAVLAYYLINVAVGARESEEVGRATVRWLLIVAVVGPLAGLLAVWIRSATTWKSTFAVAGVIALCLIDVQLFTPMSFDQYRLAGILVAATYLIAVAMLTWRTVRRPIPFVAGVTVALLAGGVVALWLPDALWLIWSLG